jgi:hypothetical protein
VVGVRQALGGRPGPAVLLGQLQRDLAEPRLEVLTTQPHTGAQIIVKNSQLNVTAVDVKVGALVTFTNDEADDSNIKHQFVADDNTFDTGVLSPNQQASFAFAKTGTFPFHDVDSSLKGTIPVK